MSCCVGTNEGATSPARRPRLCAMSTLDFDHPPREPLEMAKAWLEHATASTGLPNPNPMADRVLGSFFCAGWMNTARSSSRTIEVERGVPLRRTPAPRWFFTGMSWSARSASKVRSRRLLARSRTVTGQAVVETAGSAPGPASSRNHWNPGKHWFKRTLTSQHGSTGRRSRVRNTGAASEWRWNTWSSGKGNPRVSTTGSSTPQTPKAG
jgi:hypothetical protein